MNIEKILSKIEAGLRDTEYCNPEVSFSKTTLNLNIRFTVRVSTSTNFVKLDYSISFLEMYNSYRSPLDLIENRVVLNFLSDIKQLTLNN